MFFVHKINTENQNYHHVVKKYFKDQKFHNYDLFLEKLKKINKNLVKLDDKGNFQKDSEILFPEYFLKFYPKQIKVFVHRYNFMHQNIFRLKIL